MVVALPWAQRLTGGRAIPSTSEAVERATASEAAASPSRGEQGGQAGPVAGLGHPGEQERACSGRRDRRSCSVPGRVAPGEVGFDAIDAVQQRLAPAPLGHHVEHPAEIGPPGETRRPTGRRGGRRRPAPAPGGPPRCPGRARRPGRWPPPRPGRRVPARAPEAAAAASVSWSGPPGPRGCWWRKAGSKQALGGVRVPAQPQGCGHRLRPGEQGGAGAVVVEHREAQAPLQGGKAGEMGVGQGAGHRRGEAVAGDQGSGDGGRMAQHPHQAQGREDLQPGGEQEEQAGVLHSPGPAGGGQVGDHRGQRRQVGGLGVEAVRRAGPVALLGGEQGFVGPQDLGRLEEAAGVVGPGRHQFAHVQPGVPEQPGDQAGAGAVPAEDEEGGLGVRPGGCRIGASLLRSAGCGSD